MGERSIRATSTATLPWPTMRAVSPDRSGENWERGEKREGSGGGREPGRRREGGREERERGEEREKGRRERGREVCTECVLGSCVCVCVCLCRTYLGCCLPEISWVGTTVILH